MILFLWTLKRKQRSQRSLKVKEGQLEEVEGKLLEEKEQVISRVEKVLKGKSLMMLQRVMMKKQQTMSKMDFEYQLLGRMEGKDIDVYKLIKADGSSSCHGTIQAFLRRLDRQDLKNLFSLIQESFRDHPPKGHDLVHTLFINGTPMEINMLVEKKYPLIKELLEKILNLQLEAEEESTMAFELIKFIKSLLEE
ncbi:hypothetical protein Tco_1253244 [Tanacetum coccineum]